MYIAPVSLAKSHGINKNSVQQKSTNPLVKTNAVDTVSFTAGPNLEVQKNQYKIMLTQDIWAPKLSVKMPENEIEKEALLEVLEQRQKLDRYTRLNNERVEILMQLSLRDDLMENDPSDPELQVINKNLAKRGNINSVLNTLKDQIAQEAKRNKPAIEYFDNLAKLEEEYFDKKLIKEQKVEKFWYQIKKNNINADGQYSTRELIEIVKSGKNPNVKEKARVLTANELLDAAGADYSERLREVINVYSVVPGNAEQAQKARQEILEKHAGSIRRYPGIDKAVDKEFKEVEKQFNRRVELFKDIDIRPLGELWVQMDQVKANIRETQGNIADMESRLGAEPDSEQLKQDLAQEIINLDQQRQLWLVGVRKSVEAADENREIMIREHRLSAYDYLTAKNPIINKHKAIMEMYVANDNRIPEEAWDEVLA